MVHRKEKMIMEVQATVEAMDVVDLDPLSM